MTAMELAEGYIIRCLSWQAIRANNWIDAEIRRIDGDTIECMPMHIVDPNGTPLTPFTTDRATLQDLVTSGQWEIVPVVESGL